MTEITESNQELSDELSLTDFPALRRMQFSLSANLTRVWPTRLKALRPPAMAGVATVDDLGLDICMPGSAPGSKVLTLFLPHDFKQALPKLVQQLPRLRVHPDIGLRSQGAYLSWETELDYPPRTLWLEVAYVLQVIESNDSVNGLAVLPLAMVAGDAVVTHELLPDEKWLAGAQSAVEQAAQPPSALGEAALEKAAQLAEKYSERPWLFMRYELRNGNQRLAVNWAPVRSMVGGVLEQA